MKDEEFKVNSVINELVEFLAHDDNLKWESTVEGKEYWQEVYEKLCTLGEVDKDNVIPRKYEGRNTPEREMAVLLAMSFPFSGTDEGFDYWMGVYNKLYDYGTADRQLSFGF
jgi:hypothetical protein